MSTIQRKITIPDNELTPTLGVVSKLQQQVVEPLKQAFVNKEEVIDLIALTAVCGENLLIFGPPGTAKSQLVASFSAALQGRYFEYLLTRFTEPNEIFGPVDIRKLREGSVVTNIEGMLPSAEIAFLDEVFNANSAILNSLLTILNERMFRRGRETHKLDLFAVFAASNALPDDTALRALFDRFLLRVRCEAVPEESMGSLLDAGWKLEVDRLQGGSIPAAPVSVVELKQLARAVGKVNLAPARDAYIELVHRIRHAGVELSDRRAVKLLKMVAGSALLSGRTDTHLSDLWVLRYIWDNEDQIELLDQIVTSAIEGSLKDAGAAGGGGAAVHPRAYNRSVIRIQDLLAEANRVQKLVQTDGNTELGRTFCKERLARIIDHMAWLPSNADHASVQMLKQTAEKIELLLKNLERSA
ncbi:MAG TPA: AAA family ATPase [Planctomycetota bacterium]|nr:AAA family ATPase [Planctomycetota bacterium]